MADPSTDAVAPRLLARLPEDAAEGVDLTPVGNPAPDRTLGDAGLGAELRGRARVARGFGTTEAAAVPEAVDEWLLVLPIGPQTLAGLDADTVRVSGSTRRPASTGRSGTLASTGRWGSSGPRCAARGVPLGLPRDPLLRDALHRFSRRRRFADLQDDDAVRELFEARS